MMYVWLHALFVTLITLYVTSCSRQHSDSVKMSAESSNSDNSLSKSKSNSESNSSEKSHSKSAEMFNNPDNEEAILKLLDAAVANEELTWGDMMAFLIEKGGNMDDVEDYIATAFILADKNTDNTLSYAELSAFAGSGYLQAASSEKG